MSKQFNHLNIPSHWQSYWTRFPEGHTILEALIQWVSQVDEMVDSYNELTDHVDSFKESVNNTTDGFREELDTFLRQFDDNLAINVIATLTEWESSGFLDIVIDQALDTKYHEMDERLTTQLTQIKNLENYELNSKGRQNKAFTVFRSDDGRHEEYTHALPLFSAKGIPQTIAVVSDWTTRSGFVNKDELLELQNEHGWEICSHTKTHPIRSKGQPMLPDLPESEARYELRQSRDDLREMGLDVESFIIPGGIYSTRNRQLFREYYRSALTTAPGLYNGLNQSPISTYDMYTFWVDPSSNPLKSYLTQYDKQTAIQKTLQEAYASIDYASENGGILILGTHYRYIAQDEDFTQMYSDLIDYAKLKTNVTTLNDALNQYGNIVEIGDHASLVANQNADLRAKTNHFSVGIDGKTSGGNLSDMNEFDGKTDWREFPLGVNHTPVTSDKAIETGLPEGAAGILTNHKLTVSPLQYGIYNYQVYKINSSDREYHRHLGGDLRFSAWDVKNSAMTFESSTSQNLSHTPEKYNLGITYHNVFSDNIHIGLAPAEVPGLLITQKPKNSQYGFTFQLYYPLFETDKSPYIRKGLSETEWSSWEKLTRSRIISADENSYDTSTPITLFPVGVTLTGIGSDHPDLPNTPTGKVGTLTTYKIHDYGLVGRSYQEFHAYSTGDTFKRAPTGGTTWGDWKKYVMESI